MQARYKPWKPDAYQICGRQKASLMRHLGQFLAEHLAVELKATRLVEKRLQFFSDLFFVVIAQHF
jgi:hypothetical protein